VANQLKDYDFEDLFTAGEQPGSQAAYWVTRELERRRELAQREVDAKLIAAADAQISAAQAGEMAAKAAVESARAAKDTALWTRVSAIAIAASVVVMAIAAVITALKP
jgi:hypothetical protein